MELLSDKIDDIDLLKNVIEALDNMSSDDRMKTFNELKKCRYNKFVCNIVIDSDVLRERTIEDRIKLIEELKNCGYNEIIYKIATDINVLSKRTTEEQIKLMEALKKCDYDDNAYEMAIDSYVLSERTIEEQIKLMEMAYIKSKQQKLINHSDNMEGISDITELKMYLKELKKKLGKDADVKSDTMVLEFIPDKKDRRKEN